MSAMKKFLRRLGWTVLTLIILVVAFYGEENWRGKHAWEKYRHEREALGDSFEWASIVPPPVPDAENFAATPLFAELFPKPSEHPRLAAIKLPDCCDVVGGNWRVGRVENLTAWQKCFSNDNLLAALSKYDPILSEIAEASHRPKCRFPIRYEDHSMAWLPHLAYIRSLARDYRLRALAELTAGQTDAALADVRMCLHLASILEGEPILISFLVRIAILDPAIHSIWEGLAAHRWTDTQLKELQTEVERVDQFDAFAKAMHGERLFAYSAGRMLLQKPDECAMLMESMLGGSFRSTAMILRIVPTGWWYQNMLTADRFYTATYLPAVGWEQRRISPRVLKNVDEAAKAMQMMPYNIVCKLMAAGTSSIAKKVALSQTALDQIATACALERYRLAKGELPEKLDALVPAFIAKVPHDVIDSQPLRYRRTA